MKYDRELLKGYLEAWLVEYLLEKDKDGPKEITEERASEIAEYILVDYEVHITGKL